MNLKRKNYFLILKNYLYHFSFAKLQYVIHILNRTQA